MAAEPATGLRRVFSVSIRAPLERVWAEIARTGSVQPAYFGTVLDTELRPGAPLKYRTEDGKRTFIAGEVLEVDPPRRLVHTFRFTHLQDEPTRVTIELAPEGGEVRVTVTHDRFAGETKTLKSVSGGWPFILGNLKALLERGRLPFATRLKVALMKLMMPLMPKS